MTFVDGRFVDRADAGKQLAERLAHLHGRDDLAVLALPRGGVPVAVPIARALAAPWDVILVRKLGVPTQPELGMGAIGEDGIRIVNHSVVDMAGVSSAQLAETEAAERRELERRSERYRGDQPRVPLRGRVAVLVDDGVATGSTMRAACGVARSQGAREVIVAAPVAAADVVDRLADDADEVICLATPRQLAAIGQWYEDFTQVSDEVVAELLANRTLMERARSG